MNRSKYIILFTLFFSSLLGQVKDQDYYLDISKALGYSYGIELTNNLIQEKFTDLSKKAMMSQMEFEFAHKAAVIAMEEEISDKMGVDKSAFKEEILDQIWQQYDINSITYEEAANYLDNFKEERIFGKDDLFNNFVQILLRHNPRYKQNPSIEFSKNYREIFTSNHHQKSKGLNLSIEYPKSWISQEGKRPNIIQLIKSYDESCNFTILVKDVLAEMDIDKSTLSKGERDYIYSDEFSNDMFKEVCTYDYGKEYIDGIGLEKISDFSFDKTKIDGQPTMLVQAAGNLKRGTFDIRVFTMHYLIFYENYMINVGFMISSNEGNLSKEKDKYEILCGLIASSIIITDKW